MEVPKLDAQQKNKKRTSKLWQNRVQLIIVRNQKVSNGKRIVCHKININLTEASRSV